MLCSFACCNIIICNVFLFGVLGIFICFSHFRTFGWPSGPHFVWPNWVLSCSPAAQGAPGCTCYKQSSHFDKLIQMCWRNKVKESGWLACGVRLFSFFLRLTEVQQQLQQQQQHNSKFVVVVLPPRHCARSQLICCLCAESSLRLLPEFCCCLS